MDVHAAIWRIGHIEPAVSHINLTQLIAEASACFHQIFEFFCDMLCKHPSTQWTEEYLRFRSEVLEGRWDFIYKIILFMYKQFYFLHFFLCLEDMKQNSK